MPTNSKAIPKACIVRCRREEGITKSLPDEQEAGIKAQQADKLTNGSEVQKATVTLLCKPDR